LKQIAEGINFLISKQTLFSLMKGLSKGRRRLGFGDSISISRIREGSKGNALQAR
jgi:hypothetical protein